MPLTSPFSQTSQNLQPLVMTHPNHNPFKLSGILPSIIHSVPPQPESQIKPQNDSKVEEEDDVLRPKNPQSPPPPIIPPPPFILDYQTRLAYLPTTDSNICLLSTMLLLLDGMMRSLTCIPGVSLNFKPGCHCAPDNC